MLNRREERKKGRNMVERNHKRERERERENYKEEKK